MWQQKPTDYDLAWGAAKNHCDNLKYAGFTDWRLPTSLELLTISNIDRESLETNFQLDHTAMLWSSDEDVNPNNNNAWILNGGEYIRSRDYYGLGYPLCVRGTMPSSTLSSSTTSNGDVIVTDNKTGLIWQKTIPSDSSSFVNALIYCKDLEYAGYSDWRLPNRNELVSLVNYKKYNPASNFPNMPSEKFWTSSAEGSYDGLYVDFNDGQISTRALTGTRSNLLRVRCVRGGPN